MRFATMSFTNTRGAAREGASEIHYERDWEGQMMSNAYSCVEASINLGMTLWNSLALSNTIHEKKLVVQVQ